MSLTVTAEGAGERARATGGLGVRPALPSRSVEESGSLATGVARLGQDIAVGLRPESLRRSLRVGPTPLVELHGQLGPLLRYPYGCLEQTVSRAFPLLALAPLARSLEPELFEDHDPDALVAEAIRRVGAMQASNGGFALWPRGREVDPWASVHATHFLVEARRAGHEVSAGLADAALSYVRGEAVAKPRYSGPELERTVYALYVLSRAGRPDLGTMDFLRQKHERQLAASSRALLGAAYAAAGNPGALHELAEGVEDAEQVRRQSGGNFASTARNRALLLLALLDAAPEDPRVEKLARRIARDAGEVRWNTQEAGLSLLALGQLFSRAEQGAVEGQVRVGGQPAGSFAGDPAVFRDLPAQGPVEIELAAGSRGTVWYSLSARGTPSDATFAPEAAGLEVERRLLGRDGAPLDEARVRQGDLVVARVRVRSTSGPLENVVVMQLLPAGLEVENARLEAAETLPFTKDADLDTRYVDVRDGPPAALCQPARPEVAHELRAAARPSPPGASSSRPCRWRPCTSPRCARWVNGASSRWRSDREVRQVGARGRPVCRCWRPGSPSRGRRASPCWTGSSPSPSIGSSARRPRSWSTGTESRCASSSRPTASSGCRCSSSRCRR